MIRTREAQELYRRTISAGGATWAPGRGDLGASLTDGYAVAAARGTSRKIPRHDFHAFMHAVEVVRRGYPDAYIGTWLEDDTIHVDPALVLTGHLADVLDTARGLGQRAIYSFATQEAIEVTP